MHTRQEGISVEYDGLNGEVIAREELMRSEVI